MRGLEPRWITSSSILHFLLSLIQQLLIIEISYRDFLITSLAPVVQRVDNPVQGKNLFLLDKAIGFLLSFFFWRTEAGWHYVETRIHEFGNY